MSGINGLYKYAKSVGVQKPEALKPKKLAEALYEKEKTGKLLARAIKKITNDSDWEKDNSLKKIVAASIGLAHKKSQFADEYRDEITSAAYKKIVSSIRKLDSKKPLGLTKSEIKKLVSFIEGKLPSLKTGSLYCKKEKYFIPRTVERAEDGSIYIHLKKHGIKALGSGATKEVTLSIKYDKNKPTLVANCVFGSSDHKEIRKHEAIRGAKKLITHLSKGEHLKEKTREKRLSLLFPLYNYGCLADFYEKVQSLGKELSIKQKAVIARDCFQGISQLHNQGFVHRDLHLGNILVKSKKKSVGGLEAGITDFGLLKKAQSYDPNTTPIQHAPCFIPPEYFRRRVVDPKKIDTFALGVGMLYLFDKNLFQAICDGTVNAVPPHHPLSNVYAYHSERLLERVRSVLQDKAKTCKSSRESLAYKAICGAIHQNSSKRLSAKEVKKMFSQACEMKK